MIPQSSCRILTPEKTFNVNYSDPGRSVAEIAAIGLHGWGCSKADLDNQAAQLALEGFRIVTFNFPEVESRAVALCMEERLLIIDGLAHHLRLGRFGLICHSFGAEVGLEYAQQQSQKMAGIYNCAGSMERSDRFLTSLVAAQTEHEFIGSGAAQFAEQLKSNKSAGLCAYGKRIAGFLGDRQWLVAYHRAAAQSIEHAESGGSLQHFLRFPGFKMYVHGEFDRPDYLPEIKAQQDVTTIEIPGAGHFPNIDSPLAYTDTIRMFMQQLNGS